MTDAQIDRRVQLAVIELIDDVGTDDAELRCAMRDKGCDVERADADQRDVRLVGGEHQRAAALVKEIGRGLDPDARQQRQRLVEDAPFRDGKDDRFGHKRRAHRCRREKGQ